MLKRISKTVGLFRKFQGILPRTSLITIYKSFARPHLDYGDIIYDQTFNESFHQRIESIQYNAAIAITGATRGTSSEKLYQELGLESLSPEDGLGNFSYSTKYIRMNHLLICIT